MISHFFNFICIVLALFTSLILSQDICHQVQQTDAMGNSLEAVIPTGFVYPLVTLENSKFTPWIEGASVNHKGEVFASSFNQFPPIETGRVTFPPQSLFTDNMEMAYINGVRFVDRHTVYMAELLNHRVIEVKLNDDGDVISQRNICSDHRMIHPNDIAVTKTGVVYLTGWGYSPTTTDKSGDLWVCRPDGTYEQLELMGLTNGIEVTMDEKHLLVSESHSINMTPTVQKIWKYDINPNYTLTNKRLFADFEVLDQSQNTWIDGMRIDIQGNLYVTRYGAGEIAVLNPQGRLIRKIKLNFDTPTNLELGGPKGDILHVVGRCGRNTPRGVGKGCVDAIKVPYPGRAFINLQE